jgi:hypothetical protein
VKLFSSIVVRAFGLLGGYSYAQRHGLRLPVNVSLLHVKSAAVSVPCSPAVAGYLLNISRTGLALVVPSLRFGNRFLVSEHPPLGVWIELPGGSVNIQMTPVRYDRLNGAQADCGYVIGGRIVRMADADRERLARHIQGLKKTRTVRTMRKELQARDSQGAH